MLKWEQYKKLSDALKMEYDWRFGGYTYDTSKRYNSAITYFLLIIVFLFAGYLLIEQGKIEDFKEILKTARVLIYCNIFLILSSLSYDLIKAIVFYVDYRKWKKINNIK